MKMYRQGDVLLQEIQKPKNLKQVKSESRLVLAEGEATGHAHTITSEDALLFIDGRGRLFLKADRQVELVHQEHDAIAVEPGWYEVIRQREYTPEKIRNVAD